MLFVEAGGYSEPSLWDKEAWAWKKKEGVQHPAFGGARENLWLLSHDVWGDPASDGLAGVCEPRGGDGVCEVAWTQVANRGAIFIARRTALRTREVERNYPMGRGSARSAVRKF